MEPTKLRLYQLKKMIADKIATHISYDLKYLGVIFVILFYLAVQNW